MSTQFLPPFDRIRLATFDDLPRIATVAAAGFFWSPTFQFQRPHHADFPEDTLSSYWRAYLFDIMDPAAVVLVAEDVDSGAEKESVYEALQASPMYHTSTGAKVKLVVGVCSINLKTGSCRIGTIQSGTHRQAPAPPAAYSALKRDFSMEAYKIYSQATEPAKTKYLTDQMRLSTLAVHPAYWGRGHASRLVSWCTQLADMDGVPVAVSAVPMGATVAAKAGFEEQETVRIKLLDLHKWSFHPKVGVPELWVAIRPPSQSPSNASPNSSDSSAAGSL